MELSKLEDAWLPMLEPLPWRDAQAEGLALRGRILFGIGARLLGGEPAEAEAAGAFWSLVDGARHCSDPVSRDHLLNVARAVAFPPRAPRNLRPLTVLAAVAAADTKNPGSGVARVIAALLHRQTGRLPSRHS